MDLVTVRKTVWLKFCLWCKQYGMTWLLPGLLTVSAILLFCGVKYRLLVVNGVNNGADVLSSQKEYIGLGRQFQFLMPVVFTTLNFYLLFILCLDASRAKWRAGFYLLLLLAFDIQLLWHIWSLLQKGIVLPILQNSVMVLAFLSVIILIAILLPLLIRQLRANLVEREQQLQIKTQKIAQLSSLAYQNLTSPDDKHPVARPGLLERLDQCIDQQIQNPELTSQKLAEQLFMSEKTLRRKLSELTGLTPAVYLRQRRLDYAFKLNQADASLTRQSLAVAVGFKSYSYFSRLYSQMLVDKPN